MRDSLLKKCLLLLWNTRAVTQSLRHVEYLQYAERRLKDHEYGNRVIREALESGKPQAMGKLGTSELFALQKYIANKDRPDAEARTAKHRQIMYIHAGLFPPDHGTFTRYARLLLEDVLMEMTILGVWFNLGEARIVKRYCPNVWRIGTSALHACYRSAVPWTTALRGKKVLVALPFDRTVRQQYARREQLWPSNPSILPEFQLDTLKVPPHPNMVKPRHRDWFAALEAIQREMERRDFEVMLVGAGAYSLPLVVHAKRLGKQGIHLGGATQFLFGIKGRRWEGQQESHFYNKHWSRPIPEETPTGVETVEGGCYW